MFGIIKGKDLKQIEIDTELKRNVNRDMVMDMKTFDVIVGDDFLERFLQAESLETICKDTNFILTIAGQRFGRLDKKYKFKLIK